MIQYTGGTTGSPKGAMLTHANLTAATSLYAEVMTRSERGLRVGEERVLCILPLFHIYSLTVVMLLGFRLGAELVVHPRFDAEAALKDIVEKKITVYLGVPTMHVALLSVPGVENDGFFVAASLRRRAARRCRSRCRSGSSRSTGCQLNEGWGMTETAPIGTFTPREGRRRPGSCGVPYPGTQMKFVDVANPEREVKLGERGEICVKGPNVTKGYWKKPEATANSMTADGFFRTGDVGYMDEDGFVYIVDRTKDMLLVRRVQRLSAQHRGGHLSAPVGRGSERHRNSGRLSRRDAEGLRQAEGGRSAAHARRDEGVPEGPARKARNDRRHGDPRRIAQDSGRQDIEEGSSRIRSAGPCRGVRAIPILDL